MCWAPPYAELSTRNCDLLMSPVDLSGEHLLALLMARIESQVIRSLYRGMSVVEFRVTQGLH